MRNEKVNFNKFHWLDQHQNWLLNQEVWCGEINYIFLLLGNRILRDFLPSSAWCTQKLLCAKLSFHNYFFVLLLIFKLKSLEIDENNGEVLFSFVIIPLFYCKNANSFVHTKMWENPFRSASSFSSFFSVSFLKDWNLMTRDQF